VFFANIAANHMSGTVVFNPPLADGASAWFALEEVLTLAQITPLAALPAVPPIATPTMSTWAMLLLGGLILLAAGWTLRRRS
jgi:hypothetical protein